MIEENCIKIGGVYFIEKSHNKFPHFLADIGAYLISEGDIIKVYKTRLLNISKCESFTSDDPVSFLSGCVVSPGLDKAKDLLSITLRKATYLYDAIHNDE